MGNIAVINMSGLSPLAYEAVFDGASSVERIVDWALNIPDLSSIVFLADEDDQKAFPVRPEVDFRTIRRSIWTDETLIEALAEAVEISKEFEPEALFYAWGDCPLMDGYTTQILWKLHYKYDAEYTFADGYPFGLSPEILAARTPAKLKPLATGSLNPVERNSLFEILRKDINAFDVETHLSPEDLRMERVSISTDSRRNKSIAEGLFQAGGIDAESLCRIIPENRNLLRSLPAYFPVQISSHCPQACSYCPFPKAFGDPRRGDSFMEKARFIDLVRSIADFAGDAVVAPSLWGEPASHPQIYELISEVLSDEVCSEIRILVETSGIGWNKENLRALAETSPKGRLMWIVSIDAADPDLYKRLRGEGMEEAEETARLLSELFGDHCWIQAVRMNDNEENLEDFYDRWKDVGAGAIIQKHDSYAGYLDELQPADLSPLDRFPCWHIKRDMPILIDGTVPTCRTDLGRREVFGNVFSEDIAVIWARGKVLHEAHVRKEYPGPCAECDEYYTFNF